MPHLDEISRLIGVLQGTVSVGFQEVHRRMGIHDQQDVWRHREILGHVNRLNYRLDKKKNGSGSNGEIPTIRYVLVILGLLTVGTLARMAPGAFRSTLFDLMQKILTSQLGGGG